MSIRVLLVFGLPKTEHLALMKINFEAKGLRQGDPASPILFNIVADMLATLVERAKLDGQISGVISHLVGDGLSILQYVDDTIL